MHLWLACLNNLAIYRTCGMVILRGYPCSVLLFFFFLKLSPWFLFKKNNKILMRCFTGVLRIMYVIWYWYERVTRRKIFDEKEIQSICDAAKSNLAQKIYLLKKYIVQTFDIFKYAHKPMMCICFWIFFSFISCCDVF